MIRGYVTACNTGIVTQLPEPLEWELVRADKAERDSFFFTFPFPAQLRQTLSAAIRFQAKENGTVLFTGVVDGYTVSLGASGCVCKLYGRSTAALLMDNESPAAQYTSPTIQTIVQKYVTANGVACMYDEPAAPGSFTVALGDSAMKILSNYAAAVDALPCRVRADGVVRFTFARENSGVTLTQSDIISAKLLDRRRGVVSEFRLIEDDGYLPRYNSAFLDEGGQSRRYLKECILSENHIVYETMRNRRLFRLLLPGTARLEPAANFTLRLQQFSFEGTLYVTSCRSFCSEDGLLCEITAAQY